MKKLSISLLLVLVFLPGCGPKAGTDDTNPATSLLSPANTSVSSNVQPQSTGVTNYERTKDLPEGPYSPAVLGDVEAGDTSWLHFLNPDDFEFGDNPSDAGAVLMVRFEQYEGSVEIACGVYQSDVGQSYLGTYSYSGDGVFCMEVGEWFTEPLEDGTLVGPLFTVQLRMEWPPERKDVAVITITNIGADADEAFASIFDDFLNVPLAYVK